MKIINELKLLQELLDKGSITQNEFDILKSQLLKEEINISKLSTNKSAKNKRIIKNKNIQFLLLLFTVFVLAIIIYLFLLNKESNLVPFLKSNGKYIYVDYVSMKSKIATEYEKASLFKEGIALVYNVSGFYYINTKGMSLNLNTYDDAHEFFEGFAAVKKSGKWGFIDLNGKNICEFLYEDISDFENGYAAVKKSGKWGLINKSGTEKISCKYDYLSAYSEGYCIATYSRVPHFKYSYVDTLGKEKKMFQYDYLGDFKNGVAQVGNFWKEPSGGDLYDDEIKYGFIDVHFNQIIPNKYVNCAGYSESIIPVKQNDKWGYIDKNENTIVPFIYDNASDFKEGVAILELNNKKIVIDTKGNHIFENSEFSTLRMPSEGLFPFWKNDKWGYANMKGEIVIKNIYDPLVTDQVYGFDEIGDFTQGFAKVCLNQHFYFIDKSGREYRENTSDKVKDSLQNLKVGEICKILYPNSNLENSINGEVRTNDDIKKIVKLTCNYQSNGINKIRIVIFSDDMDGYDCHFCGPNIEIADIGYINNQWKIVSIVEKFDEIEGINFRNNGKVPGISNMIYNNANAIVFDYSWIDASKIFYFAVDDLRKL